MEPLSLDDRITSCDATGLHNDYFQWLETTPFSGWTMPSSGQFWPGEDPPQCKVTHLLPPIFGSWANLLLQLVQ